jgi:hypothetical protein
MSKSEMAVETAKAGPAIGVSGFYLFGYPVEWWVLAATGLYYALLALTLLRDKWIIPLWQRRKTRLSKIDPEDIYL